MLVSKSISYHEIETTLKKYSPKLCQEFFLFDYFESEKIGADKKSLAVAFIYQHSDKTLSDDDVTKVHNKFITHLQTVLPIEIR